MKWNSKPHYRVQAPARARDVELLFRTLAPVCIRTNLYRPHNVASPFYGQIDSMDHPVMIDLRTTAAELYSKKITLLLAVKKHEMEFKTTLSRSSSRSSQRCRAPVPNTRPPSVSEQTYIVPTTLPVHSTVKLIPWIIQ